MLDGLRMTCVWRCSYPGSSALNRRRVRVGIFVALLATTLFLNACVTAPQHPQATNANAWPLLAPAALGESRQVAQLLRGEYGERTFSLRCVVTVQANQLTVIGVTGLGVRAFTLKYDGEHLSEERAPQVPDALQADRLLNDLQLAYWPLPALQKAWQAVGGEVSEPYPGTRRLQRDGQLLAEVHYATDPWNGRVWLRHFDYPYNLFIETGPLDGSP